MTKWKVGTFATSFSTSVVIRLSAGDRVAMEVGIPCSQPSCTPCRTGKYNGCPDVVFFSTPPYHGLYHFIKCQQHITEPCGLGTLTRWHVHPEQWLHRLPDNVTFEEGALCEPLAVALAGIDRAGLRLGDPTLIWYAFLYFFHAPNIQSY